MEVLHSVDALREWLGAANRLPRTLVPTMGALHRGHASLFDLAKVERPESELIATIFVNPTQFGPGEDFDAYPRQLESDLETCRLHGVEAVFVPAASEMYSKDASILVTESRLSNRLCGASRPGHFDGVCTVVAKLFHLTQPAAAIFGEKDFQQLAVIRRMVRDLNFPIEIIPAPTVRENDGLAMSSRNAYLSAEERLEAAVIYRALSEAAEAIKQGTFDSPNAALERITETIRTAPHAEIDYVEIVDSESLEPLESFGDAAPRFLAAVFFGKTRLIDNLGCPD